MRIFLIAISICFFISVPAWSYYVEGGKVHSESGQEINLYGVSWFGFETNNHVVHGLWARNWKDHNHQCHFKDLFETQSADSAGRTYRPCCQTDDRGYRV